MPYCYARVVWKLDNVLIFSFSGFCFFLAMANRKNVVSVLAGMSPTNSTNSTVHVCEQLAGMQLTPLWVTWCDGSGILIINLLFRAFNKFALRSETSIFRSSSAFFPEYDLYFTFFHAAGHFANFIFIATTTSGSFWERYTQQYTGFVNSGVVAFLLMAIASGGAGQGDRTPVLPFVHPTATTMAQEGVHLVANACLALLALLLLPALITHVLPMMLVYLWVMIILAAICFVMFLIGLGSTSSGGGSIEGVIGAIVSCVVSFCVLGIQLAFDYGVLLYAMKTPISPHDYLHVVVHHWTMVNDDCWGNAILHSAKHSASFASLF